MKMKRWLCLLAAACLTVTLACPALGQGDGSDAAYISENTFAALVQNAFPQYRYEPAAGETLLTYERALAMLCAALGVGGDTPADNLTFAIESDLLPAIAWDSDGYVTPADAQAMIAAFAACRDAQAQQDQTDGAAALFTLASTTQSTGATAPTARESAAVVYDIDYNGMNDESYGNTGENRFLNPVDSPFSTFALDVDTASYSNIRRCLLGGYYPETGAVRIEEMLNYFDYDLPQATADDPIAVTTEVSVCPWNTEHLLAMVALRGYEPDAAELPGSNLVFLVDVSGSMEQDNRLPLAQQALKLLLSQLTAKDTVTIITYAGTVGTLLDTTPADRKETIENAIDSMNAGGATNGAGGIEAAYQKARDAYIEGGNNRVILLTDGDFNVGVQSASGLQALIEQQRDGGIYLSVLGFGMGNLKDYEMETLADCGNGNYAYIDTLKEAKKVLVDDMTSTIFTIAEDVKLQVEFNPQTVAGYRLIGYENRLLDTEDFTDDTVDAGEMGAGHRMIALYEIVPAADGEATASTTTSRYQQTEATGSDELLYVSVRYRLPQSGDIVQTGSALTAGEALGEMSETMAFASAVAEFGLLLDDSAYKGGADLESVLSRAAANRGDDPYGYRAEFVQLVSLAQLLAP